MRFKMAKQLYTSADSSDKLFKKQLTRIRSKRPVPNLFVVTTPIMNNGIMEIYNYNELLQPYYRKQRIDINILGIASSRDRAKQLVCDIIDDSYDRLNGIYIDKLFGLDNTV